MSPTSWSKLAVLGLWLLLVPSAGSARASSDALPFFTTFTVTGDYVVAGIDLPAQKPTNGAVTGTIQVSGVPANADIVAAYLYWETIWSGTPQTLDALIGNVRFRGEPVSAVKISTQPLGDHYSQCWSNGGDKLTMMRADVRRLLPPQLDASGKPTGRRLVNHADLLKYQAQAASAGFTADNWLLSVSLPEAGTGNKVPQSAGASLLIVYREADPDPTVAAPPQPLRTVVVYDGVRIQDPGAVTTQTIRGFLQSSVNPAAKITHIVGSGAKNQTDQLWFSRNGSPALLATDPFVMSGAASDRAWSNPTYDVSSFMPGIDPHRNEAFGYGEEVTTQVSHGKTSPYDCLAWAAIIFSTTVQDRDGDGLVDKLEDVSGLLNPAGIPLPDIHSMGATSSAKDVFVEIGAMKETGKHNHMPAPGVLREVARALRPIRVHFDVGPLPAYTALGPEYAYPTAADTGYPPYLIDVNARGGEAIEEKPSARFPGYKGVVSWPSGFQLLALSAVDPNGRELVGHEYAEWCGGRPQSRHQRDGEHDVDYSHVPTSDQNCRRRFDLNREGIFHYLLYAHAEGLPKSTNPADPNYLVPKSTSGMSELPGRFAQVTLGLWDGNRGTERMQMNTTLHELGHMLGLWHGGAPPTFTNLANARANVFVQPNCKQNYFSIMSYLFQATGLVDKDGASRTAYSDTVVPSVRETALSDGPLTGEARFRPAWYAPKLPGTLGFTLGLPSATKHCNGTPLLASDAEMVRLDVSPGSAIDWGGDGGNNAGITQDVNFDGQKNGASSLLVGFNDLAGLRLNQVGAGRNLGGFSLGLGLDYGGLDFGGLDYGGLDFGGLDFGGLDFGGLDFGGLDFGGLDFGGLDFGGLDFGGLDFGGLDFGGLDFGGLDFGGLDFGGLDFGGLDFGGLDFGGVEPDYATIIESGGTAPAEVKAYVRGTAGAGGTDSSVPAGQNWVPAGEPVNCLALTPDQCHRIRLDWSAPSVGTPDAAPGYAAFRVLDPTGIATAPTPSQVPDLVGTVPGASMTLVDQELPNNQRFIYWVRAIVGGKRGLLSNYAIVRSVNAPPVAVNDTPTTLEDTAIVIDVVANDADPDTPNANLRVVAIGGVHGGIAELLPDRRRVRFTPDHDANSVSNTTGGFGFTYQVDDGTWNGTTVLMSDPSNVATVSITVTAVNDPPSFVKGADITVNDDAGPQTAAGWASALSVGSANEAGQALDFLVSTDQEALFSVGGLPGVSPNGTLTFTPALGAEGIATVSVALHDGGGTSDGGSNTSPVQQFTITVHKTNPLHAENDFYSVLNVSDLSTLRLNGDAAMVVPPGENPVLRLVPSVQGMRGSAFARNQVRAGRFSTSFTFRMTNPFDGGADGVTFTIQASPDGPTALGAGGGALGYAGVAPIAAVAPSVAVEFDTWLNPEYGDADSNHVGINVNGSVHSIQSLPIAPNFDNGDLWTAWIDYDGATLNVRVSPNGERPAAPTMTRAIDIPGTLGSAWGWVGFTSATGAAAENVDVVSWTFVNPVPNWTLEAPDPHPAGNSVLANDTDPGHTSTVASIHLAEGFHGTVVMNPDGTFVYSPTVGYESVAGPETFTYTMDDGHGHTSDATVNIWVTPPGAEAP